MIRYIHLYLLCAPRTCLYYLNTRSFRTGFDIRTLVPLSMTLVEDVGAPVRSTTSFQKRGGGRDKKSVYLTAMLKLRVLFPDLTSG